MANEAELGLSSTLVNSTGSPLKELKGRSQMIHHYQFVTRHCQLLSVILDIFENQSLPYNFLVSFYETRNMRAFCSADLCSIVTIRNQNSGIKSSKNTKNMMIL